MHDTEVAAPFAFYRYRTAAEASSRFLEELTRRFDAALAHQPFASYTGLAGATQPAGQQDSHPRVHPATEASSPDPISFTAKPSMRS